MSLEYPSQFFSNGNKINIFSRIIASDDYFFFKQKGGDYSREAINRGMAIIQGHTVSRSKANQLTVLKDQHDPQ